MHLQVPGHHDLAATTPHGDHVHWPHTRFVLLSSADSDLTFLAAAARRAGRESDLAVVNLARLDHPHAAEHFVEEVSDATRLVVVRLLGGPGYWRHGLEALRAATAGRDLDLAVVPGEDRWNPELEPYATVDAERSRSLWRYFVEGGAINGDGALAYFLYLADDLPEAPAPAIVLPPAGLLLPDGSTTDDVEASVAAVAGRPAAPIVFYRSLLHGDSTEPILGLVEALGEHDIAGVPVFVTNLKNRQSAQFLSRLFSAVPPAVVLNTTAFAVSRTGSAHVATVLDAPGVPVLQVVLSGMSAHDWEHSQRGLSPRDLTMNVVLPEIDGRVLTRPVSFKERTDGGASGSLTVYRGAPDRARFVAEQAARLVRLASKPAKERRVAIVLSNYPDRDGRIANGVGLDTPESVARALGALSAAGYGIDGAPAGGAALMDRLLAGTTNAAVAADGEAIDLTPYRAWFATLPDEAREAVEARWGPPTKDARLGGGHFPLAVHRFGNIAVGIQPARGYGVDPKATYHDPDLVPPHAYLAFYLWLREVFEADVVVHFGKHGNLEWLPGKATGLSQTCWPEIALGPVPLVYPFIVNDPGEGSQAKRRNSAVVVDHLMPAMTRAEIHGDLARLETLVDELYQADGVDRRRRDHLAAEIVSLASSIDLDRDLGIGSVSGDDALQAIDAHLCDLKEMQIRDGLHIFGTSPSERQRIDTLVTIARVPRSGGRADDASLHRAIADDLDLGFDPLDCAPQEPWSGPRPEVLASHADGPWRTTGDTVERIEMLAADLVATGKAPPDMPRTAAVLAWIATDLAPALDTSGDEETRRLLDAVGGRFVAPGPSGAPTRGRADVLPTGRNFYSVDVRGVPTEAAWSIGRQSAEALAHRYRYDHGDWPRSIAMSAWGTSNMRTGGDDIAQVLALIGARPVWEAGTGRVTGFTILPLAELERPRIDVTLRISGMFRDAFPTQIDLIDAAVRAVAALDEDDEANPLAGAARAAAAAMRKDGTPAALADAAAASRIFGARPGAYGAGVQALIDHGAWETRGDIAEAFLAWGGHVYGAGVYGEDGKGLLAARLASAEAVFQAQDNREHDILDSDDYYQFQGGLAATVEVLSGRAPATYHGDTSRYEKPVVRALAEEIARVVRGRAANPKWIAGVMRHGYKGAFEIGATVDYLFAYAATTDAVGNHHFDQLWAAYLEDGEVLAFLREANAPVLGDIARRLREAVDRGLWSPRSNSAYDRLSRLIDQYGARRT